MSDYDLTVHLRAMAGMLAEEHRNVAEETCLDAASEIERLRKELSGLKQHYEDVCRENRPSIALHDAAIAERDAEIERLLAIVEKARTIDPQLIECIEQRAAEAK